MSASVKPGSRPPDVVISAKVPPKVKLALRDAAVQARLTRSSLIRKIIERALTQKR